ncbi:MAG TPA: hypothetical protein VGQ51_07160 [Puia sp.]|nr:hypothetical protein [Puia sp.]
MPDREKMTSGRDADHLVPGANRLLSIAAKTAWRATKLIAGIVIRIPGWFVHANKRHISGRNGGSE